MLDVISLGKAGAALRKANVAKSTAETTALLVQDLNDKLAAISNKIGEDNLMTIAQTIVGGLNEILGSVTDMVDKNTLDNILGDPTTLNTTAKKIVAAINEIKGDIIGADVIGDASTLTTVSKIIVDAINELKAKYDGDVTTLEGEIKALQDILANSGGGPIITQVNKLNSTANSQFVLDLGSSAVSIICQVYKLIPSPDTVTESQTFNNTNSSNFTYNAILILFGSTKTTLKSQDVLTSAYTGVYGDGAKKYEVLIPASNYKSITSVTEG